MIKKLLLMALALLLLAVPLVIRWLFYYQGRYTPGPVPRPHTAEILAPTPIAETFVDEYLASPPGTILVDQAHQNRFEMEELNVLQARLAARGQRLEPYEDSSSLARQLRYAKGLLAILPGKSWESDEIQKVQEFVAKGGRLLLVADPTRYDIVYDEWGAPISFESDVSTINDLAAPFGLMFEDDYLYNTVENEGNFRNIKLTDFSRHPLTQGLNQIAFYAAHSIVSDQPTLIRADGETRSSTSEQAKELAVVSTAANGAVLALGDLTFMTQPYSDVYDNDQFIANIADFLSGASRQYDLADFPFFFGDQVDLVYTGDPLLDSALLQAGSTLQTHFAAVGKELSVRGSENAAQDTLFLGLYTEADEVESYLTAAEVTLSITDTETLADDGEAIPSPTPESAESLTVTIGITLPAAGPITSQPAITLTADLSPSVKNRAEIASLGEMVLTGTCMLALQDIDSRQILVVLADTESGLDNAIQRLTEGDLQGCLLHASAEELSTSLALCSSGEASPGGEGGWSRAEAPRPSDGPTPTDSGPITDTVEPAGPGEQSSASILIIALDEGEGRYDSQTSTDEYVAILDERYQVSVWSKSARGTPSAPELLDYDLIIWTAGDYEDAFGDQESEMLFFSMLEGIPTILSGAYLGDTDTESAQRDIEVEDVAHPMNEGFEAGEVIDFLPAPSGSEYEIDLLEGAGDEGEVVVLVRGPSSEDPGTPAAFVIADDETGVQVAFLGFPLYLLPEEARIRLVLNTVTWMLGP